MNPNQIITDDAKDFSLMDERDRRNNAGTLGQAPADATKVLVVDDWRETIHKLSLELQALKSKPGDELDFKALQQIDRLQRALRGAKKLGINPQGPRSEPKLSVSVGEKINVESEYGVHEVLVQKVKADGRLRVLRPAGVVYDVGQVLEIDMIYKFHFVVSSTGAAVSNLRQLTADEISAREAAPKFLPITNTDAEFEGQKTAAHDLIAESFRIHDVSLVKAGDGSGRILSVNGVSAAQLARRARKAKRLAGIAERKAWREDRAKAVRELMGDAVAES